MKKKRIFICAKDIMIITGTSKANAWKRMQHLRDALGKKKGHKITFKEYAGYYGVDVNEILEAID